ncbi:hypothetical protein FIBSPDRAFT_261716 [Athelia psychrophila]|uniref:Uncharacterized protein n=1 Tax=Athelia psychrophila TaxID=1759441 RepID=A0A165XH36_9AGAM|nr:hypothetical protein FIBSPDRAFT_261716 [Fibularhizoctonia sp. CBS 109695]
MFKWYVPHLSVCTDTAGNTIALVWWCWPWLIVSGDHGGRQKDEDNERRRGESDVHAQGIGEVRVAATVCSLKQLRAREHYERESG